MAAKLECAHVRFLLGRFAYHAAALRTPRRTLLILTLSSVAVTTAACTGDDPAVSPTTPPGPSTSGSPTPSGEAPVTSNTEVRFKPGEFHYAFKGINSFLTLDGSNATLKVTNGTGDELGAPSVYAITGDGRRYDGDVAGAEPLADGATVTLDVTFSDKVTAQTAVLVVLSMGSATLGAMPPVPVA